MMARAGRKRLMLGALVGFAAVSHRHVAFRMFARRRSFAAGGVISVTIGFVGYA